MKKIKFSVLLFLAMLFSQSAFSQGISPLDEARSIALSIAPPVVNERG